MGRVDGKIALITGAARGQGRAHAVRLAEEGAHIIAMDLCEPVPGVPYAPATEGDLAETVRLVEGSGRRILARKGDARRVEDVEKLGISLLGKSWEITEEEWQRIIDINLTAVWRVAKAAVPSMIEGQRGGSIIFTTSGAAARAVGHLAHYASTKTGLIGLCREMALELGPYGIRVNTLQPTTVQTEMMDNESMATLFTPDMEGAPLEERRARMMDIVKMANILPVAWVQPEDMANGALFLASDESRMVTGGALRIDAGFASH
jgi:NAD(P)-dependent dehydrogenase (short-subunit alcohol dehydrogenase family)